MEYTFNIDEIFEIAVQMEKNGLEFYQKAADVAKDPDAKKLLQDLSKMEAQHKKTFSDLRTELIGAKEIDSFYDPQGEGVLYLRAIANTQVFFERKIDISSFETVLKEAIMAEKDSIVYYLGMKEALTSVDAKSKMESIIAEEMSHVRILSEKLFELKKT
ncbi:ferritin family protein [bacterium]|nr:ferritin family protein [bacterium]